ncbi:hypothetical protein LIER_19538 [Lithospermum erythrorhizon]|uniref:LAZY1 n=1 Tax=Lithospermum erythrorhizon TaxID=34254 RepID=A0AAV3QI17_LITER
MHRKLRQNNGEEHKELSIRQPSVDELQYFPHPSYCRRSQMKGQRESQLCMPFSGLETAIAEEKHLEEESADQNSELFHGFLTIGTFGIEPITNDPSTPTFSISAEDKIVENTTEATENELKLINDQLEKLLAADINVDGWSFSSGRNSHVSTGRSSHGSTITQSDRSRESADSIKSGTFLPLQEYLLRSANDFPEIIPEMIAAKKDHRVSLGELFQKAKEENSRGNSDRRQKRIDKSAIKFIKKMLKGKAPHSSSRSSPSNAGGTAIDSPTSPEKKIQKILQIFQRKVHPDNSTARRTSYNKTSEMKHGKQESKGSPSNSGITMSPGGSFSGENTLHLKSQLSSPQSARSSGDLSSCKKEYWINTDSEYLVLEL